MSDFEKINPNIEAVNDEAAESIDEDDMLKDPINNIPKPDEEELEDIFTNDDGTIGEDDTLSEDDFKLNPEDMTGLEELQNLFSMLSGGGSGNILDKPQVIFQKIDPTAELPEYAHPGDAGMDIRSIEKLTIPPIGRALVHTGLRARIPEGFEIQVRPRSGLALKHGVTVLNTPGTIDSGYRGEIGIILANFGDKEFNIRKGDRVAQLVFASVISARVLEGDVDKDETDRGEGGFGSTGVESTITTTDTKEEPTENVPEEGNREEVQNQNEK